VSSYSWILHLPLATGWVNSTRLCWMVMDSINGFPLPSGSTGRVEDIEKGFISLAGLWGLKTWLPFSDWKIPGKKEGLEAEDCTWKWKLCPPHTIFGIRSFQNLLEYWAWAQKESSHRLEILNEGPWNGSTSYSLLNIYMVHQLPRFFPCRIREMAFQ